LLLSRMDLLAKVHTSAQDALRFPAGCKAGRMVGGWVDSRRYSQQSALCSGSPHAALSAVRKSATSRGYEVLTGNGRLLARNRASEITVFAWNSGRVSAAGATSLVFLQVDLPERAQ
jgi:hypothetical protein